MDPSTEAEARSPDACVAPNVSMDASGSMSFTRRRKPGASSRSGLDEPLFTHPTDAAGDSDTPSARIDAGGEDAPVGMNGSSQAARGVGMNGSSQAARGVGATVKRREWKHQRAPLQSWQEAERTRKQMSSVDAVFSLLNSVLGVAMLTLPIAFSRVGLYSGVVLLGLCAFMSLYTLVLVERCWRRTEVASEYGVRHRCGTLGALITQLLGPSAARISSMCVALNLFGAMVSANIVITTTVTQVLVAWFPDLPPTFDADGTDGTVTVQFTFRQTVNLFVGHVIFVPLTILPNYSALRWFSRLAGLCIIGAAGCMVFGFVEAYMEGSLCPPYGDGNRTGMGAQNSGRTACPNISLAPGDGGPFGFVEKFHGGYEDWLAAASVFVFAFVSHSIVPQVLSEMVYDNPTGAPTACHGSMVMTGTVVMSTILYVIVGVLGYMQFTEPCANVALSYGNQNLSYIMQICVMFALAFGFPTNAWPCRDAVCLLCFGPVAISRSMKRAVSLALCAESIIIAMFISNIQFVVEIMGAFVSSIIAFVIPFCLYTNMCYGNVSMCRRACTFTGFMAVLSSLLALGTSASVVSKYIYNGLSADDLTRCE